MPLQRREPAAFRYRIDRNEILWALPVLLRSTRYAACYYHYEGNTVSLTLSSTYSSRFSNKKKKRKGKEEKDDKRRARELARQRDLTENEELSEVIRHLEALARRKSSNSLASSLRVLVVAGDKGGGGMVPGDDLCGKAAPFFQPAGESKSASFANRMGSGSRVQVYPGTGRL